MRVLVTGGRDYDNRHAVFTALDHLRATKGVTLLIHGAASGADSLAAEWAKERGVPVKAMPADWQKHGRAAGPIRNSEMLAELPELCVAFPGGRGTADMVRKAKAAGVRIFTATDEGNSKGPINPGGGI